MKYKSFYNSPFGKIIISADETELNGLWFEGQKYFNVEELENLVEKDNEIIKTTKNWLETYFSGQEPDFMPKINLTGTNFQIDVWKILQNIPYGKTITYGEIAREIARNRGLKRMSSQAVGGAVGHNKIAIIIPCHRVLGANGKLIGYAGGLEIEEKLLKSENSSGCPKSRNTQENLYIL